MSWLGKLSRNLGLMVHHIIQSPKDTTGTERQEVRRTVEEQQLDTTTTLRRTTIEEIEIKQKQ